MSYPSVVTTFTDPVPTEKLNSPSHSSIETAQNEGLEEVQTFVGTESSAVGTLMYDIRATASGGGGHVQSANKGGTGQTVYTATGGDLLLSTSSSVIAKKAPAGGANYLLMSDSSVAGEARWSSILTLGSDDQILTRAEATVDGVKWADSPAVSSNKIVVSGASSVVVASTVGQFSIFSATIPGSTLGTDNAVRAKVFVGNLSQGTAAGSVLLKAQYAGNDIGSTTLYGTVANSTMGTIEYTLIANAANDAQRTNIYTELDVPKNNISDPSVRAGFYTHTTATSSVLSDSDQTFGMTINYSHSQSGDALIHTGYTVEQIT